MFRSGLGRLFIALLTIAGLALAAPADAQPRGAPDSFADLAQRLTPAVVNISSSQTLRGMSATGELEELQRKLNRQAVSLGSGFIIDPSGVVVTNNHVIDNADEISVTLNDGREFRASVRGRDRETDLAVLEIMDGQTQFPYVEWGGEENARVGDWVVAIGNPFGLGGSVTVGIVSARNRDINSGKYDDYIQTDAAINRGNSGGPLFDMEGRVIGVNTAIYSQTGASVGVGFAVPSDLARTVVEQLLEFGETHRGWLGASIEDVTPELASRLGLSRPAGALVTQVISNSPAADAGLQPDDVVMTFNRRDIETTRDLLRAVADTPVGESAPLVVLRDGRRIALTVTVDRREARVLSSIGPSELRPNAAASSGLTLEEATEEVKRAFGLATDVEGVVVTAVDPDSPAAIILKPGDVILEIGWEKVTRPMTAADKLAKLRNLNSGPVQIYIQRGDLLFYESLRP